MRPRLVAYGAAAVLATLVASPLFGAFEDDTAFPISTYPMFASDRPRVVSIAHAEATGEDGRSVPVPPEAVANDEVIQAFETVRQAIRDGPAALDALCRHVARELALGPAAEVRIVTETFDAVAYFEGQEAPLSRTVHATCPGGP